MKLQALLNYRIKYMTKTMLYYSFFFFGVTFIGMLVSLTSSDFSSGNQDITISTLCFLMFVAGAGYNSDFKTGIQFGTSRNNIFKSYILSNLIISVILALFSVLIQIVFKLIFGKIGLNFSMIIVDVYTQNILLKLLITTLLYWLSSSFGNLFIGLYNSVSRKNKLVALGFLILLPILIIYLIVNLPSNFTSSIVNLLSNAIGYSNGEYNFIPLIITFTILIILINIAIYLNISKKEIKSFLALD
ncbi:hypothetical protein [Mycoplasma sp. P36-A1]|uniref:hypothetical protein n=1 Tax=Mycoplasma sp. P36-A1 TaxID=3252900 RepID=UPI003C306FEF